MQAVLAMPHRKQFNLPAPKAKPPVERWIDTALLKQVPLGHLLGAFRVALLLSPCCHRRIRVQLDYKNGRWLHVRSQRCPRCHQIWRLKLKISPSGFVLKAHLELLAKYTPEK